MYLSYRKINISDKKLLMVAFFYTKVASMYECLLQFQVFQQCLFLLSCAFSK